MGLWLNQLISSMFGAYHLFQNNFSLAEYERSDDVRNVNFEKPVRVAVYAIRKSQKTLELMENFEGLYVQYSLDQFKKQKRLDLKLKFQSMLEKEFVHGLCNRSGKLDTLLRVLLKKRSFFEERSGCKGAGSKLTSLDCDFVSYRGTLAKFLTCQYEGSPFVVYAELFKNTIFLELEKVSRCSGHCPANNLIKFAYADLTVVKKISSP